MRTKLSVWRMMTPGYKVSPATRYFLFTHHREKLCIYNVINNIAVHWDRPNPLIQTCPLLWPGPGTFRKSWTKSLMRSPTLGCVPLAAVVCFQTGTWVYMYIILTTDGPQITGCCYHNLFLAKNLCFDTPESWWCIYDIHLYNIVLDIANWHPKESPRPLPAWLL